MKYDPSKIRDYYFLFKKSTKLFYIVLLFSCVFTIAVAGFFAGPHSSIFWIFSATVLAFASLQILIFSRLSRPQIDLSKVIFGISNQISPSNMPIPKPENYGHSGFSEVLKFIYMLDSGVSQKKHSPNENFSSISQIPEVIRSAKLGFVVLDQQNNITFKNDFAVDFSQIRKDKIAEIFDWIEAARAAKIRDTKTWERVSNVFDNHDDQKLYDIVVFFEKQFEDDVAIFFIDKTANYDHDESDLNFIAFAAHEIRGPITIIRGYLDILSMELDQTLTDQQKELFTRLIVSSNKLSGYINNILNVAKFDQNRLEFSPEEHTLGEIFDSISEDISIRASAQNRQLEINIPHNLPTVGADIYGASEVMINLIDNAIKYSNDGGLVKIWAEQNDNFVEVHVQDFGIGIPDSVLGNLFSKFYRSHRSRETVAGSGIGLYISKAITEMMGGKISVKSTEGKGSIFTVHLPIFTKMKDSVGTNKPSTIQIKNHGRVI